MPANEDSREDTNRSNQLAELRADVRHLQSDVAVLKTDLKTEVRAINQTISQLGDRLDKKIADLGDKLDKKVDAVRDKADDKITALVTRMEGVSKSVDAAKLWFVLLLFSVVGSILFTIARALKWL